MGTRSMIYIVNDDSRVIASIYTQHDGYLEGVGMKIYEVVTGVTAGYGQPIKPGNIDEIVSVVDTDADGQHMTVLANNGIECFAASFIKYYKSGPLNQYLYVPPETTGNLFDTEDPTESELFLGCLDDDAKACGADYMYILYQDETDRLMHMKAFTVGDIDNPIYNRDIYQLPKFLKEMAEMEEKAKQQQIAEQRAAEEVPITDWPSDDGELEFIDMSGIYAEEEEHATN